MKLLPKILLAGVMTMAALVLSVRAATARVGQPAPDFTLTGLDGQRHALADFKGKTVVLEWVNPDCPFVKKHYDSQNMQHTQRAAAAAGVVWLLINSAAAGKEGDYAPAAAAKWLKETGAAATAYLRDPDGAVGHLYDARTTPHLFIVNPAGVLVYAGGIDNIRSTKIDDIAKATNYVKAALADLAAGRPVATATSQPYGCSVKY
ncbi:MAG: thioredoxin family protein [Opitutae bacterium]|nr:thioredoxin family protein [Opitutae bacterium]